MQINRLFDYLFLQKEKHPLDKSVGHRVDGEWKFYSTQDLIDSAYRIGGGLLELGLKAGDKVAVVSYDNRPEWLAVDLATQMTGMISVPLYPTISSREYEFILNDAGVKYAFVGDSDLFDKVNTAKPNVPTLQGIFTFNRYEDKSYWEEMARTDNREKVDAIKDGIKKDDLTTIIYTSGTTGNPKGVMLTHGNIIHVVEKSKPVLPECTGKPVLSFLPLCHIFERAVIYAYFSESVIVHFCGTKELGGPDGMLSTVRPYFFSTVPRLLEKVYEAIYHKGSSLKGAKKQIFNWALKLTDKYDIGKKLSTADSLKFKLADKLVYSKWRAALGGNVQLILVGAAACPVKVARMFSAGGIPVREGYGLTEASPTISLNLLKEDMAMLGTVGPVIEGVEVLIDDSEGHYKEGEGEILATGPNIMQGYYNNPEANEQVFKEIDGIKWFRTGDVGRFVENRKGKSFLKITDRKKELLKTSGGKYVAPAPIENQLKEDFLVEQAMIVGENKKFVSALILPARDTLKNYCEEHEIEWTNLSDLCQNPKITGYYQQVVDNCNKNLSHVEQIKKFILLPAQWEPEKSDGTEAELTPTLKLKRRVIREKYSGVIDSIYGG